MADQYTIEVKNGDELTEAEKEQLMRLSIAEYPPFETYYKLNKYYSVIKPQMVGLVRRGDEMVGKGKLLWQDILIGGENVKLFGFGVLVDSKHQGQGLGTELIKKYIEKSRELKAGIIYASTTNSVVDNILLKLGFQLLSVPVEYTHAITGVREKAKGRSYVLEVTGGLIQKIQEQGSLYLGPGPI